MPKLKTKKQFLSGLKETAKIRSQQIGTGLKTGFINAASGTFEDLRTGGPFQQRKGFRDVVTPGGKIIPIRIKKV